MRVDLPAFGNPIERRVGEQLELEPQPLLLAVLALLGEARRPARVRQEARVAASALTRRAPRSTGRRDARDRRATRSRGRRRRCLRARRPRGRRRRPRAASCPEPCVPEPALRCGWSRNASSEATLRLARSHTSPPRPPSPPSGPPRGTCASRRNATQPAPPSPPFTLHCATSTNPDTRTGYGPARRPRSPYDRAMRRWECPVARSRRPVPLELERHGPAPGHPRPRHDLVRRQSTSTHRPPSPSMRAPSVSSLAPARRHASRDRLACDRMTLVRTVDGIPDTPPARGRRRRRRSRRAPPPRLPAASDLPVATLAAQFFGRPPSWPPSRASSRGSRRRARRSRRRRSRASRPPPTPIRRLHTEPLAEQADEDPRLVLAESRQRRTRASNSSPVLAPSQSSRRRPS